MDRSHQLELPLNPQKPTGTGRLREHVGRNHRRSFLRWVGGKATLLEAIVPLLPAPQAGGRYFEPMAGGGSIGLAMRPERAVLADVNEHLIETWRVVRDDLEGLVERLRAYDVSREAYYETRARRPETIEAAVDRAARFVYLNQIAFNGMYRVNSRGDFNVPYGGDRRLIIDDKFLRGVRHWLAGTELRVGDFESTSDDASDGDVVYFDPPYWSADNPTHAHRFTTDGIFGLDMHARLAQHAQRLRDRGAQVFVSHTVCDDIGELYPTAIRHVVQAPRKVRGGTRGTRDEWVLELR